MHAFPVRAAVFLVMFACASCGNDDATFKTALQTHLDANRQCLDLGAAIGMPAGVKLADGQSARWTAKVMSYDAGAFRNRLNDYEKAKLLVVETIESRPSGESVLVPPQIFTIAVRPGPGVGAQLEPDGRRVCRSRRVEEILSLGEPFSEQGENFRKGRFRIAETGPDFPATPEMGLRNLLVGLSGGNADDPTRVEALFRVGKAGPEVLRVGPAPGQ